MTNKKVKEYDGIKIGDWVSVVKDSGFQAGKTTYHVVENITVCQNTPEEQIRLFLPAEDAIFRFVDGSLAGCHDRIEKAAPPAKEKFPQKVVAF